VKRKLLLWMVLFAAWVYGSVLLAPEANAADNPCGLAGGGVPGNPYEISNADQLQCLSQFQSGYLSGHFKLTSNIIMTGRTWNPIGDYANPFAGVFDGNGFRIVGLTVSGGANTGMFGFINGGTIKNLGLEDVQVSSNGNGVGGLAGSITNGRIESSYVTGSVSGVDYVGGLAGLLDQSIVEDSYAMVNVSSTFEAGGLVAYITGNSTISDSYVIGTLLANHRSGGIAAQISSSVVVTKTYTVVNILGNPGIYGMLVASNQGGDVSDSYWSGAGDAVGDNKGRVENVWELSESQLKQKSSFGAFDFDNKWAIMEGISYPYLKHSANLSITTPTSPFTYLASGQNVSINGTLSWGVLDSPLRILYMVTDANNVALKEGQLASAASIFSVSQNIGPLPIGKYNLWIWGLWASKGTEPHRIELHAVPDAPGGLQAEAGDRSVTLTWNGVTGADSYTVYVYQGETEPEDEQLWQIAQANVTGTSHTVTGLTYGETYWFKVSAVAQGMEGAVTDKVSAVPKIAVASVEEFADLTVPYGTPLHEAGLPANVQVTLVNNETKSVPVSWDNGDPVYDETKPGTYTFTGTLAWPDYVIQPASPTTIRVHVQPAAPENLIAEAGDRKVTLTWGAVKNADSYKIYMAKREQEPDAGDWRLEADNIEDTTYTVTGLTYGETYWFKVSAVAQGMEGAVTDKVSAVPKIAVASVEEFADLTVPYGTPLHEAGLPANVQVTLVNNETKSVPVSWDNGDPVYDETKPGTYTFTGTLAWPDYVIQPASPTTIRVHVQPAAPENLIAEAGDRKVTLTWGAVKNADSYKIYMAKREQEPDAGDWRLEADNIEDTTYTVTGLTYGETYWFKVSAVAQGMEGAVTDKVSAVPKIAVASVGEMPDILVPNGTLLSEKDLPSEVEITLADDVTLHVAVKWDKSTFPLDWTIPGAYTLYGTLDLPSQLHVINPNDLKAKVRVLVRPAAPGSLQAIAGDRQVTLMWGAVPGGENATVTYTVYKYQGDYESLPIDLKDWQMVAMGIKDTFYTVEGLDYGKTYWFKVQAKAHGLEGTVTPTVSAVPWVPVKSVETLADITVQHGTAWNNLGLPDRVQVTLADYSTTMADVDWSSNPPYDGNTPGTYTFTGTLDLPDYINNDEAQLKAEVRVTVLNPPDSDSSSGGGPSVQSKVIEAKLETAFGKEVAVNIVIIRTWENGIVRDRVTLTPESMQEAWQTILENGGNFARVILPDEQDEVTEVDFRIVAETIRQLREAKVDLEIFTENVRVRIPASSLAGVEEDVSFKLVPVREKVKRQELEERARANQAVITIARGQSVEVLGRPVTIETNLQNRPVTLILPLTGVELPGEPAAREDYLADLAVYIEHSDGSREVVTPQVVEYKPGIFWLQFTVNKFSAFVILKIDGLREKAEGNSHKAYMKGYADGTFRPDRTVTRAEMAAILARNLGFDGAGNGGGSFADVKSTHWAVKEIEFVKDSGLMVGDGHGHFRPDAPITRGEMAAIAARFKQLDTSGYVKSSFSDVEESYWAFASMEAAKAAGIIDGYTDGTFRPHGPLTRAEAVKIINRMFERGPLHGVTVPSWPDVPASHWAFAEIEEASRDHHYTVLSDGGEQVSE